VWSIATTGFLCCEREALHNLFANLSKFWVAFHTNKFYLNSDFEVKFSQGQVSDQWPLPYASRQMNTAEKRYASSDAETLALVWECNFSIAIGK